MKAGTELTALTGLRGIAAIYVVLLHYFTPIGPWKSHAQVLIGHGYLAVDVFFILSGFVMALNYRHLFAEQFSARSYRKFLGRRIARIYPLYFVTLVIAAGMMVTGMLHWPKFAFGPAFLQNLLMVQAWHGLDTSLDGPAWSLSTEWAAYLLFPLLLVPALFRGAGTALAAAALCAGFLLFMCIHPPKVAEYHNPKALLDYHTVGRCVAEFTLGLLTFRIADSSFGPKISSRRGLVATIALLIVAMLAIPRTDLLIVFLLPPLLLGLSFGDNLPKRLLSCRPAEYAGMISYSLYLTHYLMNGLMLETHKYAAALGLHHAQTYAAGLAMTVTVPVAICLYHFVEKPGRALLRNLFEGKMAARSALADAGG